MIRPASIWNHYAVPASRNKMIHFQVLLPPTEEDFYVPSELIDCGNLLSSEIIAVSGLSILWNPHDNLQHVVLSPPGLYPVCRAARWHRKRQYSRVRSHWFWTMLKNI